jgi:hypothetical protein
MTGWSKSESHLSWYIRLMMCRRRNWRPTSRTHADDRTVKICLFVLRGYLLLMFGLLGFGALQLAGVIKG